MPMEDPGTYPVASYGATENKLKIRLDSIPMCLCKGEGWVETQRQRDDGKAWGKDPMESQGGTGLLIASEGAIFWYHDLGDFNLSIVM